MLFFWRLPPPWHAIYGLGVPIQIAGYLGHVFSVSVTITSFPFSRRCKTEDYWRSGCEKAMLAWILLGLALPAAAQVNRSSHFLGTLEGARNSALSWKEHGIS